MPNADTTSDELTEGGRELLRALITATHAVSASAASALANVLASAQFNDRDSVLSSREAILDPHTLGMKHAPELVAERRRIFDEEVRSAVIEGESEVALVGTSLARQREFRVEATD